MNTYEIMELKNKIDILENEIDEETGEFIDNSQKVLDLLETYNINKEDKLKAIIRVIKQKRALIDINKEEIKSMQNFTKQEEKNIIKLNNLMGVLLDGENIKINIGSFYYGKDALYFEDENEFKLNNPNYIIEKQSIKKEIDKAKVLKDIENLSDVKLRKNVIFRAKK